jgi:tRNA threonylcarbamoyl adenosine modification protein YeaZ
LPDRPVLGFDTSAAHCAAALLCDGRVLAARAEEMGKGQAERLMPLLEELLAEAGLGWADLAALGVGTGPGNFTGIRIAVSAARGLSLALGIPAHGVTGFEATANGLPRPCAVTIPAMRGQVYLQRFSPDAAAPEILAEEALPGDLPLHPRLAPEPLAIAIAREAAGRPESGERPAPLYLRGADAAPPREAPPRILP